LGVAFLKNPTALLETPRQPYQAHFNSYRHPRIQPAIYSIAIIGPYAATGPGDTPSRRLIFGGSCRADAQSRVAERRRICQTNPFGADAAGLPPSRDGCGHARSVRALFEGAGGRRLRRRHRTGAVRSAS